MVGYILGAGVVSLATAGVLVHLSTRTTRTLSAVCKSEFAQLQQQLIERHVIIIHLLDCVPQPLHRSAKLGECMELAKAAEAEIRTLKPAEMDIATAQAISVHQKALWHRVENLLELLESDEAAAEDARVGACVDGLTKVNERVQDAAASYNSAAITYGDYLQSCTPLLQRFAPDRPPALVDLDEHRSEEGPDLQEYLAQQEREAAREPAAQPSRRDEGK